MTDDDIRADLALKTLARRQRLIRQATKTPSRARDILLGAGLFVIIFLLSRSEDASLRVLMISAVLFVGLAPRILLAERRITALVELLEVEKLWITRQDERHD